MIQYEANLGWPFASTLDYRDPEPYALFLLYKPNFTYEQIVGQVQDEIAKLQNQPLDAAELERIKTQLRATRIRDLQSSLTRARTLAQYAIADGNPGLINTELDAMTGGDPGADAGRREEIFCRGQTIACSRSSRRRPRAPTKKEGQ